MGETTKIIEEMEKRQRGKFVDGISQNPITSMLAMMIASGGLSGFGVDQLFGGTAAREQRDAQIALVVEAAEKAATQYQARIDGLNEKIAIRDERSLMLYNDLQACQNARATPATEEVVP